MTLIQPDVSASMSGIVGQRRCIDILEDSLREVLPKALGARVIGFASGPNFAAGEMLNLPEPRGSTALDLALEYVGRLPKPKRLIIITDGEPDDDRAALAAARALAPISIDCVCCGDESDRSAIAFLRSLTLAGGTGRGWFSIHDLTNPEALTDELPLRLTGPP